LIQCRSDSEKPAPSNVNPNFCSQNDAKPGADDGGIVRRAAIGRHAEVARDRDQVVLGQDLRAGHQLHVLVPEAPGVGGALDQFGGAARKLDPDQRPMAKDVAHAIAELVAHLGDALVGGRGRHRCRIRPA
jgi:hypothetical protein